MSEYTQEQQAFLDFIYATPFSGINSITAIYEGTDKLEITLTNPTPQELSKVAITLLEIAGKYEYDHKAGEDYVTFTYDKRYGTIHTIIFPIGHRIDYELDNDDKDFNPFELN